MLKKIAMLLPVLVVLAGCTSIYYDSETRLVLQGQLVDKDGGPLSGLDVEIKVSQENAYGEQFSDVIASGYSDEHGNFKFAIPAPQVLQNVFSVNINRNEDATAQQKSFVMIMRKDFADYRFDLGAIPLYKPDDIAVLEIYSSTTNDGHFLQDLFIEGIDASRTVQVNPYVLDYIDYDYRFELLKNQTVVLHYTVIESGSSIQTNYAIPIGINGNTTYNLSY